MAVNDVNNKPTKELDSKASLLRLSWVFQGNIGEIIAPFAGPEQQIIVAIQNNQRDKIQDLLENKGVSPSCRNHQGTTPIHVAVKEGYKDIAEMLLRMGGDLAAVDNAGNSTLHYAAKGGYLATIEWLIQEGLSASALNSAGQTPYDVSENHAKEASLKELLPRDQPQGYLPPQLMMPQQQPQLGISTMTTLPSNPHSVPSSPLDEPSLLKLKSTYTSLCAPPLPEQPRSSSTPLSSPIDQQLQQYEPTHTFSETQDLPVVHNPYSSFKPRRVVVGGGAAIQQQHVVSSPLDDSMRKSSPDPYQPALSPYTSPHVESHANNTVIGKNRKAIRPDGFHSSASDKSLQKRYNHTRVHYDLAPPPTALQLSPAVGEMGYNAYASQDFTSQAPHPHGVG